MPQEIVFDDDDPFLIEVRQRALAFPEANERISHGRPTFWAPDKVFTVFGGSVRNKRTPKPAGLLIKIDPEDRPAIEQDQRFFSPAYWWPHGWMGLDLAAATVDWDEVGELLDASYRLVAPKRLVKLLD